MSKPNNALLESTEKYAKIVISLASTYAFIIFAIYFWKFNSGLPDDTSTWGQFGDFIGGTINPFFGLLSLLALLWTLIIQSKELSQSTSALKEQSEHLDLQAFENTFFSLIRLNNDIAQSIDLQEDEEHKIPIGRPSFKEMSKRLEKSYTKQLTDGNSSQDPIHTTKESYKIFYQNNQSFVGNYLNNLERILEFIEKRCPPNKSKEDYVSIVRAQLTTYELFIIFYHSLSGKGALEIFKLNTYYFFQNLPNEKLLNSSIHKDLIKRKQ